MSKIVRLEGGVVSSLNTLTGVAIGTAIEVQNVSLTSVKVQTSATQPDMEDYKLLMPRGNSESIVVVTSDSLEVWVSSSSTAVLSVEEL